MGPNSYFCLSVILLAMLQQAPAAVVDRVALVIDKTVVTESEVNDELRLTAFLNNQPLDLSTAARKAAAERLIDQELIRRELEISAYPKPSDAEAGKLLDSLRAERFHSESQLREALEKYGITEDQLKRHLLWQLTALRFTDARFRAQLPLTEPQSADRATDGAANTVDQQLDAWLKDARGNTKITFKKEAFQ